MRQASGRNGQRPTERHSLAAGRSSFRAILALWLIVATAAQGVLAQGHVHFRYQHVPSAAGIFLASAAGPNDGGAPDSDSRDGSSTCALCQVLAFGAAPLGHSFDVALALQRVGLARSRGADAPIFVSAVSYIWTSRGPPLI